MLKLVIDCSVTMAWHFPDERTPETDSVLKRLGSEFELCAVGLNRVRKELDELQSAPSRR